MSRGSGMLRFDSELDIERLRAARRERFNGGKVHVPERDVLAAVLEFMKRHPKIGFCVRMNSGVTKYVDQKGVERFVRFGFKGCPDVWAMLRGGRLMVVEVKGDSGKATAEQRAVLDAVANGGGIGIVAYSIDDVAAALEAA